jgi:hypothetical protein
MNKALQVLKNKTKREDFDSLMKTYKEGRYEEAAHKLLLSLSPEQRFTILLSIFKKSQFRSYSNAMKEVSHYCENYLKTKDLAILEELGAKFSAMETGFFHLFQSCVHSIISAAKGEDGFYMLGTLSYSLNIAPTEDSMEESNFFKEVCITLAKHKWPEKAQVLEVLYGNG